MLKKKERLTRREFDRFFSVGKRLHGSYIQLIYAPSPSFHCSVVVGKKVYKKAVERNSLRRKLYASVYSYQKVTPLPYVCIIVVKAQAKEADSALVRAEVASLMQRL